MATPPTQFTPSQIESLSPRLAQVAELLTYGLSPGQIAAELGIAPGTLNVHLRRLYARLGVHSSGELVARILWSPGHAQRVLERHQAGTHAFDVATGNKEWT